MFAEIEHNKFITETKNFIITYTATDSCETFEEITFHFDEECAEAVKIDLKNVDLVCFNADITVIHKESGKLLGESCLGNCLYENYKEFIDYVGIGYSSSLKRIADKNTKEEDKNHLRENVKFYEKHGYNRVGSSFKDAVKEAIQEAKLTNEYVDLMRNQKMIKKVSNF
jgi:hypothetical protein